MSKYLISLDVNSPEYLTLEAILSSVVFHRKEKEYIDLGFVIEYNNDTPIKPTEKKLYKYFVLLSIIIRSAKANRNGIKEFKLKIGSTEADFFRLLIMQFSEFLETPDKREDVALLINRKDIKKLKEEIESIFLIITTCPVLGEFQIFKIILGLAIIPGFFIFMSLLGWLAMSENSIFFVSNLAGQIFMMLFVIPVVLSIVAGGLILGVMLFIHNVMARKYYY